LTRRKCSGGGELAASDSAGEVLLKKIDLHIHTVPTISDSAFTFSVDTFKRYVAGVHLDAVAVTNHDVFDGKQFRQIQSALGAVVFPGIEINVEEGHVLVIASASELEDFEVKTSLVTKKITKLGDRLSIDELQKIFGDLSDYLVIPHSDKAPPITGATLQKLKPYISAGEVDSAKKFVRAIKDETKPTPVLFSDARMRIDLATLPTRQTFVDCGDVTLSALKASLRDKGKVALSEAAGNKLWQVFESGERLSTGLNVLVGARSTGKTHTLNRLSKAIENVKYIKQFSLVQQDEDAYEREFKGDVERRRSTLVADYLSGLKTVLDDVMQIDLFANEKAVERYVATLVKSAEEADRRDAFSKTTLFDAETFPIGQTKVLQELIGSVRQVIENVEFRITIEKHVDLQLLKRLACELIKLLWARTLENSKKNLVNEVIKDVKQGLRMRTAAVPVEDVDLYKVGMDAKRIRRFRETVDLLKREAVVFQESIQGFRVEAKREPFAGAGELKEVSRVKTSFAAAFRKYSAPYDYLRELMSDESLSRSELYKLFVKITYRILNKDGFEVSGGERSEFRLLQEIADAQNYDILLIDEPESSFDNLFLNSNVNQILKDISETMPVVVVTHNSTVGASVGADYVLYTSKELQHGKTVYRIYSGHPSDKQLFSPDGKAINCHEVMLNSLEAGVVPYESRRKGYEAIKD
jgi:ABC-type phosphate transport system ATPase subunit